MNIIFTKHATQRMEKRGISREETISGIKTSDITIKKHGKYYHQKRLERGTIEICCERKEKFLKIITVYWV